MKFNQRKNQNFFSQTSEEIKSFLQSHQKTESKKIQKKMPIQMLVGIRKKQKEMERNEREFNAQANIRYNSFGQNKSRNNFKKKEKNKFNGEDENFQRKFKKGNFGDNFKNGILTINKKFFDF